MLLLLLLLLLLSLLPCLFHQLMQLNQCLQLVTVSRHPKALWML